MLSIHGSTHYARTFQENGDGHLPIDSTGARTLWLMRWGVPAIGLATLCNGAVFWLRRIGWLQRDEYWLAYQTLIHQASLNPTWERYLEVVRFEGSLHSLQGALWLIKIPKEFILAAVAGLALVTAQRARHQPRALMLAYAALFALVGYSAATALIDGHWLDVMAGGRSFLCWAIAAVGVAVSTPELRRRLSLVLLVVLVIQGLMAPIELALALKIYKMQLWGHDYPRIVGSFGLPLSLGVFAVVTWSMAVCWASLTRRSLALLTALVVVLLLANGSATAWAMFVASAGMYALNHQRPRVRLLVLLAAVPAAAVVWQVLPQLTGRDTIHESLFGRVLAVQMHAQGLSTGELLIGQGFGFGTNGRALLTPETTTEIEPVLNRRAVGDSMPASLLWQTGALGLLLAYGLIVAGLSSCRRDRPLGIALLLASLTLNVAELFPINLVFGLWLANAWATHRERPPVLST